MRKNKYKNPKFNKDKPFKMMLQLFKGGSSTTNVQSYKPTAEEVRLQKASADYAEYVAPNARWLNDTAANVLRDSIGTVQVDFNGMNNTAQQQVANAQQGVQGLTTGELPAQYQANMEAALNRGVQNTMGNMVNSLGARGVLNSSVTNKAMDDMSKSVSDTMAEQYQNNIGVLNGLYGQQAQLANAGITTGAAAQEAAQAPSLALWNASLGLNGAGTSALGAVSGQGTTTTTSTQSGGGGGVLGGLVGLGTSAITAFCFADDTKVKVADGTEKRISNVHEGDEIVCYDKDNNVDVVETVTDVVEPKYATTYAVVCVDGKNNKKAVYTTLTQPLMKEDGSFVEVGLMRLGTQLKNAGKVTGIVESGERKVYDFKTNGKNNYYASGFVALGAYDDEVAE